jgi:hypothetical protein
MTLQHPSRITIAATGMPLWLVRIMYPKLLIALCKTPQNYSIEENEYLQAEVQYIQTGKYIVPSEK